jgi:predicted ester cyclase
LADVGDVPAVQACIEPSGEADKSINGVVVQAGRYVHIVAGLGPALAPGRLPGLEGTREFLQAAQRDVHGARWLESLMVAENDLVVQFGSREHHWPGGQFRGFHTPAGKYIRDTAFAYRLIDGRIRERWAIRDDLAMLLQLGALRPPGQAT